MKRESALLELRSAIESRLTSKSEIARVLNIHPSQVSRIVAGKFRRLDGHALRVCKFAINLHGKRRLPREPSKLKDELDEKVAQIVSINPAAAEALSAMLEAFINQWSSGASE